MQRHFSSINYSASGRLTPGFPPDCLSYTEAAVILEGNLSQSEEYLTEELSCSLLAPTHLPPVLVIYIIIIIVNNFLFTNISVSQQSNRV